MIAGNTVTFSIIDGGLGDDDLTANGTIFDPSGHGMDGGAAPPPNTVRMGTAISSGADGVIRNGKLTAVLDAENLDSIKQ